MSIISTIAAFLVLVFGLPIYILYKCISYLTKDSDKEKFQKAPPPVKSSAVVSQPVSSRPRFQLNGKYGDPARIPNHITLSEIDVYNNDPPERWEFTNRDQRIRYLRGKNLSPYMIYPSKRIGRFHGSKDESKIYLTTLYQCSCPDCRDYGHICKHIYSLAIRLNVLSSNVNFYYDVPDETASRLDKLKDEKWMCKRFADLLTDLQRKKLETVSIDGVTYCIYHIPVSMFKNDQIDLLIESGLISLAESSDFNYFVYVDKSYTKEKVVDAVMRYFPTEKRYLVEKMKKSEIIEFYSLNSKRLIKYFLKPYYHVRINLTYITSSHNISEYIYDKIVYPLADYIEY